MPTVLTSCGAECRQAGQLTQVEHREKGALKGNVFLQYAVAMGSFKVTVILLALLLGQATWIMSEWWLARWSQVSAIEQRDDMWLWVYGTLVACALLLPLVLTIHLCWVYSFGVTWPRGCSYMVVININSRQLLQCYCCDTPTRSFYL